MEKYDLGSISQNFFAVNLLTLLCKLDHFMNVTIIFWSCEKMWLSQKSVNLHQKSFMRLTPGSELSFFYRNNQYRVLVS
jgi:hypothetical protein